MQGDYSPCILKFVYYCDGAVVELLYLHIGAEYSRTDNYAETAQLFCDAFIQRLRTHGFFCHRKTRAIAVLLSPYIHVPYFF